MRYSRYLRAWPLIPVALVVIWLGREDEAVYSATSEQQTVALSS